MHNEKLDTQQNDQMQKYYKMYEMLDLSIPCSVQHLQTAELG